MRKIYLIGRPSSNAHLLAWYSLAAQADACLTIIPDHIQELSKLEEKVYQLEVRKPPDIAWESYDELKQTSYERANPNQPFYAGINKHKKKKTRGRCWS